MGGGPLLPAQPRSLAIQPVLFQELDDFAQRPPPFSVSTITALWTDPHIAAQMLSFHLDPETDAASRRPETISGFVDWLDDRLSLSGRRATDLGCGPGLYAQRMAERGAIVTGVDISGSSLAYARGEAERLGLSIDYRQADYLADALTEAQDLVTLIYGDYCALAPAMRQHLLARIGAMLRPGGTLVLDVYSPGQMAHLREGFDAGHRLMNGFWAAGDYYGLHRTFLWPNERISLERFRIATADRQFDIYNWMQYYTPDAISAELSASGFKVEAMLDFAAGTPWKDGPIAVVALPS